MFIVQMYPWPDKTRVIEQPVSSLQALQPKYNENPIFMQISFSSHTYHGN